LAAEAGHKLLQSLRPIEQQKVIAIAHGLHHHSGNERARALSLVARRPVLVAADYGQL